jgi:hypothetical protein
MILAISMSNKIVEIALEKLLVYATAPILGDMPPLIEPSVATTVPNSGSSRINLATLIPHF